MWLFAATANAHDPCALAEQLNQFNQAAINPYDNYHRPCLYPTIIIDAKGKQKKKYECKNMMIPYNKFRSLQHAEQYLKDGLTFTDLDDIARAMTDNEAADFLQQQRSLLLNISMSTA